MASVDRIPPRHGRDRWWLACASPDRLTQLVVRGARPGPDRLRCRAYDGDYIRSMVGRTVMNVAELLLCKPWTPE